MTTVFDFEAYRLHRHRVRVELGRNGPVLPHPGVDLSAFRVMPRAWVLNVGRACGEAEKLLGAMVEAGYLRYVKTETPYVHYEIIGSNHHEGYGWALFAQIRRRAAL